MTDLGDLGIDPRLVKALSHPLRVRILSDLSRPGAIWSPSEYAEAVRLPLSNVSHHFRRLRELDLVEICNETAVRGSSKHFYRVRQDAISGLKGLAPPANEPDEKED